MRDEVRYIAALLRAFVAGGGDSPRPPQGLEWETVARLVIAHRLAAALGPLLVRGGAPDDVARVVDDHVRAHRLRGAWMELELGRCLRALETGGIRPVLLKGVSLGTAVYPSSVERFALDLDILVRPDEVDAACGLLESLGYRGDSPSRTAFYAAHHVHRVLTGTHHLGVEVHWDLSRRTAYHRLDAEAFRATAVGIVLDGLQVRVPSLGDQLLHAAAQAADEGFSDLRRILDAALLLRHGAGEAPGIAQRARDAGLGHALWALLDAASEAAGTRAPASLVEALRPAAMRRRCIAGMRLAEACISLSSRHRYGLCELIRMLCAPDARATASRIRRYVAPAPGEVSPSSVLPRHLPGRLLLAAPYVLSLLKMGGLLAWRLAAPRPRGSM